MSVLHQNNTRPNCGESGTLCRNFLNSSVDLSSSVMFVSLRSFLPLLPGHLPVWLCLQIDLQLLQRTTDEREQHHVSMFTSPSVNISSSSQPHHPVGCSLSLSPPRILVSSHLFHASAFSFPSVCEILWLASCALMVSLDWEHRPVSQDHFELAGAPWPLAWHLLHNVLGGPGPGWPLPAPCLQTPPSGTALRVTWRSHAQVWLFAS